MVFFRSAFAIAPVVLIYAWRGELEAAIRTGRPLGYAGRGLCEIGHILLTESYRWASASLVAPFDYTSMLWALALGYLAFGALPTTTVYLGAAVISGAGLFVIWREQRTRLERMPKLESPERAERLLSVRMP